MPRTRVNPFAQGTARCQISRISARRMARDDAPLRHWKRGTEYQLARDERGRLVAAPDALERFRRYCHFDATTGCVLWTGGTTQGRGHSAPYGAFWYEGRRWAAHRWAAQHIHGQEIDGLQVDHCCEPYRAGGEPLPPNTLCVHHVRAITGSANRDLQTERRTWLLTQKGYYEAPPLFAELAVVDAPPFYSPPAWLGLDGGVNLADDDCPF
jgi:hypothetical protein